MENNYLKYVNNDVYIIKLKGNLNMNNCKILDDFIEKNFENINECLFEMSEVKYMDSTFLGLIAKFLVDFKTIKNKKIKVINLSIEAKKYLSETGIISFLEIIENFDFNNINLEKINSVNFEDNKEKEKFILKMHEILSELNEKNKIEFKPVVDYMKEAIK